MALKPQAFGYFDLEGYGGIRGHGLLAHAATAATPASWVNRRKTPTVSRCAGAAAIRARYTPVLNLFEVARSVDGRAIYATVDPQQRIWHNFEKAGYALVCTRPAYDGRMRRYYKRTLDEQSGRP